MCLGIGGEKMELLEMLENIEIAYHKLVIEYYYASEMDKYRRDELYDKCKGEFKALKKKLSDAENLEKELGIEISVLIKLFKKLNSGSIYTDDDFKHGFVWNIDVEKHTLMISNLDFWQTESKTYNFCDYKKTWWLKKDKSE